MPQLMIPNREETNLTSCFRFMQRQLFWTRLYHPHWWAVCLNAALLTAAMFLPPALALVAWAGQHLAAAAILAALTTGYLLALAGLLGLLETSVRRVLQGRLEPWQPFSWSLIARILIAIPVTQLLHVLAVASCLARRTITWRGVRYRIDGPWQIRVLENDRESAAKLTTGENISLG